MTKIGCMTLLGEEKTRTCPSGQKKILWKVRCDCGEVSWKQKQHVVRAQRFCSKCQYIKFSGSNHPLWKGKSKYVSKMLLDNIKTRGKDVSKTLTLAYLDDLFEKQNKKCAYTGEPLTFRTSTKLGNASLDRIDSSKGYIEGNLQWVHKTINEMKTDLSHDIFVEYCKKVAKKENKNA